MVDENVDKQMLDYYFMGGFICGLKNTDIQTIQEKYKK